MKKKVLCVAGARPNFMKIAPILRALSASQRLQGVLVHTGQHYDANMSEIFFRELGIPAPDHHLSVGSDSHARQTARIMIAFEEVVEATQPDLVLVVGDVNSTIACALVAAKLQIPIAHVEAGLRSRDRAMPEEINRVLTDQLSDFLFLTEASARENLLAEGIDPARIHFTGNTMIDTLAHSLPAIERSDVHARLGLTRGDYGVVTFHRPSNVDDAAQLARFVELLQWCATKLPLLFPVHPRTQANLERAQLWSALQATAGLTLAGPLPYIDFMALVRESRFVLTDSGGIQEETTWLGVPCLTQRTSTERPITIEVGTNQLLGDDLTRTREAIESLLAGRAPRGRRPELWDGHCAERIVRLLEAALCPEPAASARVAIPN